MIRIAATADVHFAADTRDELAAYLPRLRLEADLLLIAGDLTRSGRIDEGLRLADELRGCPVPVVATLGNHDYHHDQQDDISAALREAGVVVLERQSTVVTVGDRRVGIVGAKGFGGGFPGACGAEYGEPEMKAFMRHTKDICDDLRRLLGELDTTYTIALLHYSPIADTLMGERKEIYPFLGSYLMAEAIDKAGADIVFHGHAHRGIEKGFTAGGIPVRNVAQHVTGRAFNIYTLDKEGVLIGHTGHTPSPPSEPARA